MIRVVINNCHGGFSLSEEAMMYLINTKSELVSTRPIEDYFGMSMEQALAEIWERHDTTELGNGFVSSYYGEVFNVEEGLMYQIGMIDQMAFRTHPDLISVVELFGPRANGRYGRLTIVEIPDEDITLDKITISEYDGSEWVAEIHRTWS